MSLVDHWHAVMRSRDLRRSPAAIQLAGKPIVLFRTAGGGVAALSDVCPHRRMRLSAGKVIAERIQCCYHGWTFDAQGAGESPGTPKLHTRTTAFEAREVHGLVWIKSRGSEATFPDFDGMDQGYVAMVVLRHNVEAPLELVLDNFNELEHTPTTHTLVGFPLERMQEVEVDVQPADDAVHIRYRGPSRPYPWLFRTFLGLSKQVTFHVQGVTRDSPVHTYGDYRWTDTRTGKESWVGVRNAHFLTPVDDLHTTVFTLSFMKLRYPRLRPILFFVRPFMRRSFNLEINEDKRMLDGLADKQTSLEGLKLSRFDRALGLNRQRIALIYRGKSSLHDVGPPHAEFARRPAGRESAA